MYFKEYFHQERRWRNFIQVAVENDAEEVNGFRKVTETVRRVITRYIGASGTYRMLLDYFYVTATDVVSLFTGDYFCKFDDDAIGVPHQLVRREGKEFCFVSDVGEGLSTSNYLNSNLVFAGRTAKEYFHRNTYKIAYEIFRSKVKKETRQDIGNYFF